MGIFALIGTALYAILMYEQLTISEIIVIIILFIAHAIVSILGTKK